MAIAGSAMPSTKLRIFDGRLVDGPWMMRNSDVLEDDPTKAAQKLLAGETVLLRTTGDQFSQVRKLLNLRPPEDKRAATIRKLKECIERNGDAVWAGSVKVKLLRDALELLT